MFKPLVCTLLIQGTFDLTDQMEVRRHVDFLFWLVKSDATLFCLAASETLNQSNSLSKLKSQCLL